MVGWVVKVKKMAVFADVQYCIYAEIVGRWVSWPEKVQKCADVICGQPPMYVS